MLRLSDLVTRHSLTSAAVSGVPGQRVGEAVPVWIKQLKAESASVDHIRAFCEGQIAHYRILAQVRFFDNFPVTLTGKIQEFVTRNAMLAELGLHVAQTARAHTGSPVSHPVCVSARRCRANSKHRRACSGGPYDAASCVARWTVPSLIADTCPMNDSPPAHTSTTIAPAQLFERALSAMRANDTTAAVALLERAIAGEPAMANYHSVYGVVLGRLGRLSESATAARRAAELAPKGAEFQLNLGNAERRIGAHEAAESAYRRAITLRPELVPVHMHLARLLAERGDIRGAVDTYRALLVRHPDHLEAHCELAHALLSLGEHAQALQHAQHGAQLAPRAAHVQTLLTTVYRASRRHSLAADAATLASALHPADPQLLMASAVAQARIGRNEQAVESFRRCRDLQPESAAVHSTSLASLQYVAGMTATEIAAQHRVWRARHGGERLRLGSRSRRTARSEPLRVGFVSGYFHNQAVAYFLTPLLKARGTDWRAYCYAGGRESDACTAAFAALVDGWRPLHGQSHATVAERVRADGIDVLIDLHGHTAGSLLPVFVARPAPVQLA